MAKKSETFSGLGFFADNQNLSAFSGCCSVCRPRPLTRRGQWDGPCFRFISLVPQPTGLNSSNEVTNVCPRRGRRSSLRLHVVAVRCVSSHIDSQTQLRCFSKSASAHRHVSRPPMQLLALYRIVFFFPLQVCVVTSQTPCDSQLRTMGTFK